MFYADRITNIKDSDFVLDIGPGSDPHERANILLEIKADKHELASQRGHTPELVTDKKIVYYDGKRFPFKDKEFDYVICSHVLEHVEDVEFFWSELKRVGKRGYIEFPLIYYDYLYNFDVHINFLKFDAATNIVYWSKKEDSALSDFKVVQDLFYQSLTKGYDSIINDLKDFMFQGFEWDDKTPFTLKKSINIKQLTLDHSTLRRYSRVEVNKTQQITDETQTPLWKRIFRRFK